MPSLALTETPNAGVTAASILVLAFIALLMLAGFALLTCGLVRKKNAAHLVMLSLTAYVCAVLAYSAVGYAFQFGGAPPLNHFLLGGERWGLVGGEGFFLNASSLGAAGDLTALSQTALMLVAAYILVGAICERITFWSFALCELFVGGVLYPLFGCWVWGGGWLSQIGSTLQLGHGYIDLAGSSVVHEVGGFSAMALALLLGPRLGKYGRDGKPRPFPAHNIVFVVLGTAILLSGWLGLNVGVAIGTPGVSLSQVAVNSNLAAAAGGAAAMIFWQLAYGKPDISMACNGLLAGLVAISAGCALVGPTTAALVGALGGLAACGGVLFNERVLKIDDPCGSIAVHGYGGWLGAVAVGLFADGTAGVSGLLRGDSRQFLAQIGGATLCAIYAFGLTYVVFTIVNRLRPMRVEAEVEIEGLDLHEFGMLAYPEDESLPL